MSSIQSIFVCRVSEFAFSLCLPEVLMTPNHLSVTPSPPPSLNSLALHFSMRFLHLNHISRDWGNCCKPRRQDTNGSQLISHIFQGRCVDVTLGRSPTWRLRHPSDMSNLN